MMSLWAKAFIVGCFLLVHCDKDQPQVEMADDTDRTDTEFLHPGIISDGAILDRLYGDGLRAEQAHAFTELETFIRANPIRDDYPTVVFAKGAASTPTEAHIRRDAVLAYAYALKWARTGEEVDARQTIRILNGWAQNFVRYSVVKGTKMVQTQLEAAWVAPSFAAAAEIMRYHKINGTTGSGWSVADIEQFSAFLINMKDNYIDLMVKDMEENGRRQNNWGASAGYAKMAIGVFLDDQAVYEDGKRIIKHLIPVIIKPDGEVYELCSRDCHHPQYSMTALTYAAEIARRQGDSSLYEADSKRIETGWDWIRQAQAGNIGCRDCSGASIFPGIEVAISYYDSPALTLFARMKRPYSTSGSHTFLGFTTFTHFQDN